MLLILQIILLIIKKINTTPYWILPSCAPDNTHSSVIIPWYEKDKTYFLHCQRIRCLLKNLGSISINSDYVLLDILNIRWEIYLRS